MIQALPLPEVAHGFSQRVFTERRQLQVWFHVLLAHRHLTFQTRFDRKPRAGCVFLFLVPVLKGSRRGPVRRGAESWSLGGRCRTVVARHSGPGRDLRYSLRRWFENGGARRGRSTPAAVVVGDVGQLEVLLEVGAAAVAVAALRTTEATSIRLPLQAIQAGLAEVVAARKQVGVPVQVQAHGTGELLLQDAALIRQGRGHDASGCGLSCKHKWGGNEYIFIPASAHFLPIYDSICWSSLSKQK